jgi:DeoR/GlpR family transcriptional regulator of sugar metabolism
MTVRRDLADLEARGMIRRVRGGAIRVDGTDPGYSHRSREHLSEKQRLGRIAAQLVSDGETIFLDAGTTAAEVARALADRARNEGIRARVVTHAINIGAELAVVPGLAVHQLGGEIDPATLGATGPDVIRDIHQMNFDLFFMGVTGVDPAEGLTNSSRVGVEVKRTACARARKVWVVADGSKWKNVSFYRVTDLTTVHGWVTDAVLQPDECSSLMSAGLQILQPEFQSREQHGHNKTRSGPEA